MPVRRVPIVSAPATRAGSPGLPAIPTYLGLRHCRGESRAPALFGPCSVRNWSRGPVAAGRELRAPTGPVDGAFDADADVDVVVVAAAAAAAVEADADLAAAAAADATEAPGDAGPDVAGAAAVDGAGPGAADADAAAGAVPGAAADAAAADGPEAAGRSGRLRRLTGSTRSPPCGPSS
jgi:hypothetical protein